MAVGARKMIVAMIQARTTSTRLPGKVLMDIGGQSSLARVVAAAGAIRGVDKVEVLWAHNYPRVPENDVLSRYYWAWKPLEARAVMRLTADCPLLDPKVCELVLESFLKYDVSYASNVYPKRTFPDGLDCEVFSGELLARAYAAAESPEDREHVTPWMQRNATVYPVVLPVDWSHIRLTLDEQRDLDFLRTWVAYQGRPGQ
jgi:spore coat polysaccharide biosynthesis protein SpsF (cytidylyltransferase family)